jgi:hypothetical protein
LNEETEISEVEQKISATLEGQSYVVMPFHEKKFSPDGDYFLRLHVLAKKHTVILWGSHSHWSLRMRKQFEQWMEKHGLVDRWLVTGDISQSLGQQLLQNAEALVLAGLKLTPLELTDYFLRAIHNNCTLILDSTQAGVHGTLWKNGQNCWILQVAKINSELTQLMHKNKIRLAEAVSDQLAQERYWLDHPLNELNRLYNRALEQKA